MAIQIVAPPMEQPHDFASIVLMLDGHSTRNSAEQ
jgi:prepilin-type processing-associated H-X9-DG protein